MTLNEFKSRMAALDLSTYNLLLVDCLINKKMDIRYSNQTDSEYLCIYRNQHIQVKIYFHSQHHLRVLIVKNKDKMFSISAYYIKNNINLDIDTLFRKKIDETTTNFLERTLDFIVTKFFPDIKHILVDGAWEEINFDWQGYK